MVHSHLPASNPAREQKKKQRNPNGGAILGSLVGLDSQQKSALQHDIASFEHPESSQCPNDNPRLPMHERCNKCNQFPLVMFGAKGLDRESLAQRERDQEKCKKIFYQIRRADKPLK